MNRRNQWLAGIVLGVLIASSSASAAVNASELHIAMASLKLALAKMGVANAILSDPKPPSSNAEARLAAPTQMGGDGISAIRVSAGGVINVYLAPATGTANGVVQLVPKVVTGKEGRKRVQYTCYSPNIPDIATAAPECTYHPLGK